MTEGTGWAGKLKLVLYARLEELSFRSAMASAAGVLVITGLGVSLTVTSGGGHQEVALPSESSAVGAQSPAARSSPAESVPLVQPSPSVSPTRMAPHATYRPGTHPAARHVATAAPSAQAAPVTSYPGPAQRPIASPPWRSPRVGRPGWPSAIMWPGHTAFWIAGSRDTATRPNGPGFGRPLGPAAASPFPLAPLFSHGA